MGNIWISLQHKENELLLLSSEKNIVNQYIWMYYYMANNYILISVKYIIISQRQ